MKKENVHAKHKKSLAERFWKQKYLFLLLLPSLVWVILICYAPMTGLYMSFINYTPQGSGYFADMVNSQFVGLDWFKYFFSTDFTKIMRNTLAPKDHMLPAVEANSLRMRNNSRCQSFWRFAWMKFETRRQRNLYRPHLIFPILFPGLLRQTFSLHSFLQTASSTIC